VTPGVKARARELRDWLTTAEKLRLLAGDWDLRGYFLGAPADPLVSAGDVKSLTLRTSGRMIVSGGGQGGYALSRIALLASPLPGPFDKLVAKVSHLCLRRTSALGNPR